MTPKHRVGLVVVALALAGPSAQANITSGGSAGQRPYSVLSVGDVSACALLTNGWVQCWGANDFGQLGVGSADSGSHLPAYVGGLTQSIVSVGVGRFFGCALSARGGQVSCWGDNGGGWLGDGTNTAHYVAAPVKIGGAAVTGVKVLSVGRNHACAVHNSGVVACWGSNSRGQLGNKSSTDSSTPTVVVQSSGAAISGFVDVAVGDSHSCALKSDGTVWCWGSNDQGQLGNNDYSFTATTGAVQTLVAHARSLAAGHNHACAVLTDGTASCWGSDDFGESGYYADPTVNHSKPPYSWVGSVVGASNLKAISVNGDNSCALSAAGQITCWGRNDFGQLGGTITGDGSYVPIPINLNQNAVAISTGAGTTCATLDNGQVYCWGDNLGGEAGDATSTAYTAANPHLVALAAKAMAEPPMASSTAYSSCALNGSNNSGQPSAKCWGFNGDGEVGDGSGISPRLAPTLTSTMGHWPTALTSGWDYSCSLESNGSGQCWGNSWEGALGYGDPGTDSRLTPSQGIISGNLNDSGVAMSAGYDSTFALLSNGTILAWGGNSYGQLGDGTTTNRHTPVTVYGIGSTNGIAKPAIAIAAGAYHACALLGDGTVACWGYGSGYGQLGTGSFVDSHVPVATAPLAGKAIAIAAGWYHTCALLDDGSVQCWGYNGVGSLGTGNTTSSPSPVRVSWSDSCAHPACSTGAALANGCGSGASQVCAADPYCCTANWDSICVSEVTSIAQETCGGNTGAVALTAGAYATCALNNDGTVSCWGYNAFGNLGDGTTSNRLNPWQVSGVGNASSATSNYYDSCAGKADSTVWCWGGNAYGQLGDGTETDRHSPVQVASF